MLHSLCSYLDTVHVLHLVDLVDVDKYLLMNAKYPQTSKPVLIDKNFQTHQIYI